MCEQVGPSLRVAPRGFPSEGDSRGGFTSNLNAAGREGGHRAPNTRASQRRPQTPFVQVQCIVALQAGTNSGRRCWLSPATDDGVADQPGSPSLCEV